MTAEDDSRAKEDEVPYKVVRFRPPPRPESWYKTITRTSRAQGVTRFIFVCLAQHADNAGVCAVTKPDLAKETGIHPKSIQRHLRRIEALGEIRQVQDKGGRGIPAEWKILLIRKIVRR